MWEVVTAEVLVAFLGLIGTLAGVFWGRAQQSRAIQAEAEITLQRDVFDFTRYTQEWGDTIQGVKELQRNTSIDRFLLLVVFNGIHTPRWVSDVLQIRDAAQQPISYRHLEIDESYREMVARCAANTGGYLIKVKDMPNCLLKDIYIAEGITESAVFHIETRIHPESGAAAYTICSFATHNEEGITAEDLRQCRILAGRIKGLAALYNKSNERPDHHN